MDFEVSQENYKFWAHIPEKVDNNWFGWMLCGFRLRQRLGWEKINYRLLFIVCGCIVSWKSVLQNIVVLSTTKAEYVAIVEATKEALWLKDLVSELGMNQRSVMVFCDSQSAICLKKNQGFHEKAKHIDVRFHFTGDNHGIRIGKCQQNFNQG